MLNKNKSLLHLMTPETALNALMSAYIIKHKPQLIDELSKELVGYIKEISNEQYAIEFENAMDAIASQRFQAFELVVDKQTLCEWLKETYPEKYKEQ